MPVVIKELTVQTTQDAVDKLEARLKRLEQVFSVTGDPLIFGGITNLVIKTSGSIRLEAQREIDIQSSTKATVKAGSSCVEISSNKVAVSCASEFSVIASSVKVSTSTFTVDAGMARFSGTLKASTMITNTVVASTYTPGAGNIW